MSEFLNDLINPFFNPLLLQSKPFLEFILALQHLIVAKRVNTEVSAFSQGLIDRATGACRNTRVIGGGAGVWLGDKARLCFGREEEVCS